MARQFNYAKVVYVVSKMHKEQKIKQKLKSSHLIHLMSRLAEMTPEERTNHMRTLRANPLFNKLWKELD